jgi:hypothetical protein
VASLGCKDDGVAADNDLLLLPWISDWCCCCISMAMNYGGGGDSAATADDGGGY